MSQNCLQNILSVKVLIQPLLGFVQQAKVLYTLPSFAHFKFSELGSWIKWNLSIIAVAILSIQMSGSFCQEGKTAVWNGKGAEDPAKHVKSFIRGAR